MNIQQEIGLKAHHTLGKGSFGTVYYCTGPSSNEVFAVKVFFKEDFTKAKLHYFRKQAELLQSIEHPNIVKFRSFKQTQNCIYILMEYIPGGTLKNFMKEKWEAHQKFTDEQISTIIKAVLSGIQYLHKDNIIHRDLKPGMYFQYKLDNILLSDKGDLKSLKIVDFGLSAQLDITYPKNVKAQCGTLLYMAPQILYEPSYSKAVDIWSCAIIMYQLSTGGMHPIYKTGMKSNQFKEKLRESEFPQLQNILAQNFLSRLSKRSYAQRYSVNEALKHPWITRSEYDEIPLSVNQSIYSFTVNSTISDALKYCFTLRSLVDHKNNSTPQQYKKKVFKFEEIHEQYKSNSPSMKRIKSRKKDSSSLSMRESIIKTSVFQDSPSKKISYEEVSSPLIKRHEQLYLKFFDKNRNSDFSIQEKLVQTHSKNQIPFENSIERELESPRKENSEKLSQSYYEQTSQRDVPSPEQKFLKTEKEIKKTVSIFRDQKPKGSKIDLNLHYFNQKIKLPKRNSFDSRTQTIRSSHSKKSSNKMENINLIQPISAKRLRPIQRNSVSKAQSSKKPMIFGIGGASYL